MECNINQHEFWRLFPVQYSALMTVVIERNRRATYNAAMIMALTAEIHRDREKRKDPYTVADFCPWLQAQNKLKRAEQGWQEQLAFVEQLNMKFGGTDLRSK